MRYLLLRILLIVLVASCAGLIRARNLPWIPDVQQIEDHQKKIDWIHANASISLDEFLELIDQGAVVIDARPRELFEESHLQTDSFPPVLNVPDDEAHAQIERLSQLQGYPIVLYCTSLNCDFADDVYIALEEYGFYDMKVYRPGWEGILAAGLPTTSGPDEWTGMDDMDDPNEPDSAGDGSDPNAPDEIEP